MKDNPEKEDFEEGVFLLDGVQESGRFSRIAYVTEENGDSILDFTYMFIEDDVVVYSHSVDRLSMHPQKYILTCLEGAKFTIVRTVGGFLKNSSIQVLKKAKNY